MTPIITAVACGGLALLILAVLAVGLWRDYVKENDDE